LYRKVARLLALEDARVVLSRTAEGLARALRREASAVVSVVAASPGEEPPSALVPSKPSRVVEVPAAAG
jgi:hypothetical protein